MLLKPPYGIIASEAAENKKCRLLFGNRQWQQYLYKFFPRLQSRFFPCDTIRGTARSITSNKEKIIILFQEWLEHLFLFLLSVGHCRFYSRTIQFFLSAFLTMKQMFRHSFLCKTLFNSGMLSIIYGIELVKGNMVWNVRKNLTSKQLMFIRGIRKPLIIGKELMKFFIHLLYNFSFLFLLELFVRLVIIHSLCSQR